MIDLYSWTTPNGRKVHIMLEECGLAHSDYPIDIRKGDQFAEGFLAVSPNNKIPAIIDHDGPNGGDYALFESGAILMYLAHKTGRFLPKDGAARQHTIQWLMFQMGGVGPMFGQSNHFRIYAKDKHPHSITHYQNEVQRLCAVMDKQLGETEFIAGPDYTIADMSIWPWCMNPEKRGISHDTFPNVQRWFDQIAARDGVKRGLDVLTGIPRADLDEKAWEIMFGKTQFERR
jgi:GST-like protein